MNSNLEPVVMAIMNQKKEPVVVETPNIFDAVVAQAQWQQRQAAQNQAINGGNIRADVGLLARLLL